MRVFVCGTDTDVGKTFVVRLLATALEAAGRPATIVKLAQTGVGPAEEGDAQFAVAGTQQTALELARFPKPADPWTAARAAGAPLLDAATLAAAVDRIAGDLVVEGSGGVAVPLNPDETLTHVVQRSALPAIVVVGLRLGCMNHAVLTREYLAARGVRMLGFVLVDRWACGTAYAEEVRYVLQNRDAILGFVPHVEREMPLLPIGEPLLRAVLEASA